MWSAVSRLGAQGLQFIILIILVRLLPPEAFGLIAMVVVFTGFSDLFVDLGFSAALIQKKEITRAHFDSIFWLNVGVGLVLTLAFIGLSPLLAAFYQQPLLQPLTALLSAKFLFDAFGLVHIAQLKRTLDFKKLAWVDLAALSLSGAVGIGLALSGKGVWSLVIQTLVKAGCTSCLLWLAHSWKPRLRIHRAAIKELWAFSANLLGFSTINYWFRHADDLLIGRFLGSMALGIYGKAYELMMMPLKIVSHTIGQVMFPALSIIQDDQARVAEVYLQMTGAIALVTFPMMVGLFVVAESFVLGLFGSSWSMMIPLLQVFSVVGLGQSILTLNGNIYQSQGRTDLQFKVGGTVGLVGVLVIATALTWGLYGVTLAYGCYFLLISYPSLRIAVSLIGLSFSDVVKNLFPAFLCALVMGLVVWGAGRVLPTHWPHAYLLGIQIMLGVFIYTLILHLFKPTHYIQTLQLIQNELPRRHKGS